MKSVLNIKSSTFNGDYFSHCLKHREAEEKDSQFQSLSWVGIPSAVSMVVQQAFLQKCLDLYYCSSAVRGEEEQGVRRRPSNLNATG